jgi:hypothetical protein
MGEGVAWNVVEEHREFPPPTIRTEFGEKFPGNGEKKEKN